MGMNQPAGSSMANVNTPSSAAAAAAGLKSSQIFTTSGTWAKPANVTKIKVTVLGGGGGGGGAASAGNGAAGGGGGGGGASVKIIDVSAVASVTVTIGAAGSAGGSGSNGGNGGTSSFGSYCSATGGTGGTGAADDAGGDGGAGGAGSSGDLNITGGYGNRGVNYNSGQDTWFGHGGTTFMFPNNMKNNSTGPTSINYGVGGFGARATSSGKAGTAGIIIVEEFGS